MKTTTLKQKYCSPTMEVYQMEVSHALMAGSITESTDGADTQTGGSFGASEFDFMDEDF